MDDDATKIMNEGPENSNTEQKGTKNGSKFASRAAAGFVGAAAGVGSVKAAEHFSNQPSAATEEAAGNGQATAESDTPATAEAIVETDEGVCVAHVDDSMTFAEAFAAAREQVGAGGVFEWHGKVYGTYYETEWNNMSQEERAEWQHGVDYADVLDRPTHNTAEMPSDASYIDTASTSASETDDEVHVVGVAVQDNYHGGLATIAGLQYGEGTAIVVDIDTDGTIDIIGVDENRNGQLEPNEWRDASEANLSTGHVVGAYVEESHQHGREAVVTNLDDGRQYRITESEDEYGLDPLDENSGSNAGVGSNDIMSEDMPDYMNDADAGIMDA